MTNINRHQISGTLLLVMIIISVINGFTSHGALVAGCVGWIAGLLLFRDVSRLQRIQSVIMASAGIAALVWAWQKTGQFDYRNALATNQALLAMLAAVGFLRLIALPDSTSNDERTPVGKQAIWRTLIGVHLFGAVINLSTIMIIADRQSMRRPLSLLQATVLSRGFALAALWSPFFAAMGIALLNAKGAQLLVMSAVGIPTAAVMLGIATWQLKQHPGAAEFRGYPMHYDALLTPAILAVAVMALHWLWPEISIITLIAMLSVTLTLSLLLIREPRMALQKSSDFVFNSLHRMSGELTLFLAAGVLATGVTALVSAYQFGLELDQFGAFHASLFLLGITLLASIGLHPIIAIASSGPLLLPLVDDPNLLGILYLMSWATGVIASPLSGIHLAIQGRYGVFAHKIAHSSTIFLLLMLLIEIAMLFIYENFIATLFQGFALSA